MTENAVDEKVLLPERRLETETIIRWDRTSDPVTVCTCHQTEWQMLEKAGYQAAEVGYDGKTVACKTFEIPRHQVKMAIMPNAKVRAHPSFRVSKRGSKSASPFPTVAKYTHVGKNGQAVAGKDTTGERQV